MAKVRVAQSTCRACNAFCPIDVTIVGDRVVKVEGNSRAPLYEGFICPKGRALAVGQHDPQRLSQHLKRQADGSFEPISSEQLIDEIAEKLRDILARHEPRAIAGYQGGATAEQQAGAALLTTFLGAIGSDSYFSSLTIDQPGIPIADALHGRWDAGHSRPEDLDLFMIVGGNPIISKQYFPQNPGKTLKRLMRNGMKLIVIDPRRTETARKADVHLQVIPGEDPTVIAGLIHLVLEAGLENHEFIDRNAVGLSALRSAVASFTPAYVCARAGLDEAALRAAAQLIVDARNGDFGSGVGPSMATRGTLTVYLLRCLQTLRGFWPEEGAFANFPPVLLPPRSFRAQPIAPSPAWGFGRQMRVRGLQQTAAGMPTGAMPEEILTEGEGQIRAVFFSGGPMRAWPQTDLVKKALESLELLVVHDVEMSPTARLAHYVIATKKAFELPVMTQIIETVPPFHPGYGWSEPYGAYQPALIGCPPDWDVLESWQTYYRLAQKLGLKLKCMHHLHDRNTMPFLDMKREPTTEDLYEMLCTDSVVPFAELRKYPDGHVFEAARQLVGPREADHTERLDLGNADMLAELAQFRDEAGIARAHNSADLPYLFIPRRIQNTTNGAYRAPGILRQGYNPAYMHGEDLAALGLASGDRVKVSSRHGSITAFVEEDDTLRTGVVAMTHAFGANPGEEHNPRETGANVNMLLRWDDGFDPYHGMPRMGAVPVSIEPFPEVGLAFGGAEAILTKRQTIE